MFAKAGFIVKYWLCWILFFELSRLAFLLSNATEAKTAGVNTSLLSLWFGLKMDISMAAYITLPVAIMVLFAIFLKYFQQSPPYIIYTSFLIPILFLLIFADIGLFKAWGSRLDATPLKYLSNPKEVWASISHLPLFAIFISFIILSLLFIYAAKKLLNNATYVLRVPCKKMISFFFLLLVTALFIIPIRGGFQLAPLNQSSVYFSQNNFANMAALNAPWNFLHALSKRSDNTNNPFRVDTDERVAMTRSKLFQNSNPHSTLQITSINNPNIIFIVWESFTAKVIGMGVNQKQVTPGFNKLINEGVYFTDIYATGDRTDKGIVGVLSGYPSQPTQSIIKEPVKAAKLPMISKTLKERGYHTSFIYGGELEFANMKAYLLQGKFDHFTTIDDFNKKDQNSKWGAHDGVVMNRFKEDIGKLAQPFFSTWLTLSSHEPYEIPTKPLLTTKDARSQFLSSLHYTDSIVYDFIQYAKAQPWWNNTIIVIVADHGHKLPVAASKTEDFRIPLLLLGGGLQLKKSRVNTTGSQTDIAATLLAQLKIPADEFTWSRNLLDTARTPWAFFSFNNGFGFIQTGKKLVFDNVGKIPIEKVGDITDKDILFGKVLQQAAYKDYLDR
jgi:phosphoglycerol transferase MdoB-like AlkP superfamily enzyme